MTFVSNLSGVLCEHSYSQGCNARKVISEVYTSFVLQCTVSCGNVNTRRMSNPDLGSIFHIKNQWNILVIGNYYQNLMLLISSDTKRTLMHLFLITNSAQRELVSICTQSIHDRNKLSLQLVESFIILRFICYLCKYL